MQREVATTQAFAAELADERLVRRPVQALADPNAIAKTVTATNAAVASSQ